MIIVKSIREFFSQELHFHETTYSNYVCIACNLSTYVKLVEYNSDISKLCILVLW